MAKTSGSKHRFATRVWLAEQLQERNFNAIAEFVDLYRSTDDQVRSKLIQVIFEYLYPKARPEDQEGNPDEAPAQIVVTPEMLSAMIKSAREGK